MDVIAQLNAGLVGRYTVEREIGAGGMATVFLARDLRHDRLVALKLLKPELGAILGAERFLSEIRVTAKLQHPNLLPLFDSGEIDGLLFYVMPYVEGESLRHRLERENLLPVEEALRLAIAICGALDYAHRHGVIHRDLKPENVLLHDGQPMIADFGIALAVSNAGGARVTQTGISLGTPQYMSPEQAGGDRKIDGRTDVYSVGALLYEMLTGEAPHTGATAQAIISKLMTEDPRPVSSVRRSVPMHIDAAVERALAKLPADRFGTAHELADALSGKAIVASTRPAVHSRSLTAWKFATLGVAAVAISALVWATNRTPPRAAAAPSLRFSLVLPDSAPLDPTTFNRSFDLSADGLQLTYVSVNGLFIRPLNDLTSRRLTSESARDPRFSADGRWIAYIANDTLRKVSVSGGASKTIVDSVGRFGWSSNGTIVFTRSGPVVPEFWSISDTGGTPRRLAHQRRPTDRAFGTPTFLPDGDTFLVPTVTAPGNVTELAAYRMSDSAVRYLGLRGDHPLYHPDGVLLFVDAQQNVLAVSFDPRSLRINGAPTQVLQGVTRKISSAELAVSSTGTMVYLPTAVPRQIIEFDRTGREYPVTVTEGFYETPRYSPDGRRIALVKNPRPSADVWIYDIASKTATPLTNNRRSAAPEWAPDGKRVAWSEVQSALGMRAAELDASNTSWRPIDKSDTATVLVRSGLGMSFAPSGKFVLGVVVENGRSSVATVQLDSTRRVTRITPAVGPASAQVSPNDRWFAYTSTESGKPEVYVRSINGGAYEQISVGGGIEPMWNPRGGELIYRTGAELVSATLTFDPQPHVTRLDTLPFKIDWQASRVVSSYDVSPNGERFLVVKAVTRADRPIVITRWMDDVRDSLRVRR